MLILAFDTSVAACSACLWRGGAVLASAREVMDQGQAEALMPLIESVMTEAGVKYADLDRIAVTAGPGSFTGVRVGLAAARGLGLAANKPVVGVMTTEVLAAAVTEAGTAHILAAIDTKRGDLYVHEFDGHLREVASVRAIAPGELAAWSQSDDVLVVGDGAAIAVAAIGPRARLATAGALPEAAVLARLASQSQPTPGGPLPVYVRAPDAVMPLHGGRLRP
jgi:tRNA threonylcarbamoyladenosine biosynthesis protein TsaB